LAGEDLDGALELDAIVHVLHVRPGTLGNLQAVQVHAEHVREEHRVGVHLYDPVVLRVFTVVLDLLPEFDEGVRVDPRRPRRLGHLPTGQDRLRIALENAQLFVLNVVGDRLLLQLPVHDHKAEQRSALLRRGLARRHHLPHLSEAADDGALGPALGGLARSAVPALVTREALASLEVPRAGDLIATLRGAAIFPSPGARHDAGDVRLRRVHVVNESLQVLLLGLVAANGRSVHLVPLMHLARRLLEEVAALVPGGKNRLRAALMLAAPLCALLGGARVPVHGHRREVGGAVGLPQARAGQVDADAVRRRLGRGLLFQLDDPCGLHVDLALLLLGGGGGVLAGGQVLAALLFVVGLRVRVSSRRGFRGLGLVVGVGGLLLPILGILQLLLSVLDLPIDLVDGCA